MDGSASVLGLLTAAGAGYRRLPGLALSFCPNICAGYLVVSLLAAMPYPPLHKGASRVQRQPVRLADLGQWHAVHIPWCVVAFGAARRCRQAEPFTRDASW